MNGIKDQLAKAVNVLHRTIFSATKGRIGGRGLGMPVVMLTTTGRKSGQPRRTMLTAPVVDGDNVVLVASYGGDDRHPAWYLNLQAHPDVEIIMQGRVRPMRARTAEPGEKEQLWPRIVESYKGYGGYQRRTDRDIPVVILEPRGQ